MNNRIEKYIIFGVITGFVSICAILYKISQKITGYSLNTTTHELVILAPQSLSSIASEFSKIYSEEQRSEVTVRFMEVGDLVKNISLKKKISNPDLGTLIIMPHVDNITKIAAIEHDSVKYANESTIHHLWTDSISAIVRDNSICHSDQCQKFDNIASLLTFIRSLNVKLSIFNHDDIIGDGLSLLHQSSISRMCNTFVNTIIPESEIHARKADIIIKSKYNNSSSMQNEEIVILSNGHEIKSIPYVASMQNNNNTKVHIATSINRDIFEIRNLLMQKCVSESRNDYDNNIIHTIHNMPNLHGKTSNADWDISFGLKSDIRDIGVQILNDNSANIKIWGICRSNSKSQECIAAMNFFLTNKRVLQILKEQDLVIAKN